MTFYPSNLRDSQWQYIANFLDLDRSRKYDLREVFNSILYLVKTGCQWRMLPSDFPDWRIVYYYFSKWKSNGLLEVLLESLGEKTRLKSGRRPQPTAGIIDSQSVKSTLVSSESQGFDAGKKIKGIKRHVIVDTLGLVLAVMVQSASVQDRAGAGEVIRKLRENWKRVTKLFADGGYGGKLIEKIKLAFKIQLQIVKRKQKHRFLPLPKRWIVERTFAWIDTNRRNSKNYERTNDSAVAMVWLASIRIMINRF